MHKKSEKKKVQSELVSENFAVKKTKPCGGNKKARYWLERDRETLQKGKKRATGADFAQGRRSNNKTEEKKFRNEGKTPTAQWRKEGRREN